MHFKKRFTFNDIAGSCARASLTLQGRQNDGKEGFFVFDIGPQWFLYR
ncbi:MAG: hypothetical protein MJA30_11875 [Cytophagales bacterium]|nr:hypothetical protein [Cytophagales bacterium]